MRMHTANKLTCFFVKKMNNLVAGQRGTQEHEASRRLKTELLIQMDGLNKTDDLVFLLAASNLPWSVILVIPNAL